MPKRVFSYQKTIYGGYDVYLKKQKIGQVCMEVDGYYVFLPEKGKDGGYYPEWMLLELGNFLAELNKPWDEQVKREVGSGDEASGD